MGRQHSVKGKAHFGSERGHHQHSLFDTGQLSLEDQTALRLRDIHLLFAEVRHYQEREGRRRLFDCRFRIELSCGGAPTQNELCHTASICTGRQT